jgi:hypothetical protein
MREHDFSTGAYLAEFASADELTHAARAMADKGYTMLETYSPIPVSVPIRRSRSRLPAAVFGAGLLGGLASYAIQWYANAYAYPQDIGGRPTHAIAAFMIPTFEGTVLCASLAAFFGFFFVARLPQPWHPVFEIDGFERASVDRYWLAVGDDDRRGGKDLTPSELAELTPLRIVHVEAAE